MSREQISFSGEKVIIFYLLALLAILAALPLGGRYIYLLTQLPQYEFTPVFLICWLLILFLRRREYFADAPRSSGVGTSLTVLAVLSLTAGSLIVSSWFVYLAFVLQVGAVFAFIGNWRSGYPLLPVWASLLIPLRPPLGYDGIILNQLRLVASKGASRIVDILGVPHFLRGNVFFLSDKQMFMDDACSGIISLLTCMACGALVAIWRRRGLVHFVLLVGLGAFFAVVFNIFRIVSLLCAWEWFKLDLTTGWRHEVLGYVALGGSVLFLVFADIGLNWLLQETNEARSFFTRLWNRYLANPDSLVEEQASTRPTAWKVWRLNTKFRPFQIAVAIALVCLLVLQFPREVRSWTRMTNSKPGPNNSAIQPMPLPTSFGDWRHAPEQDAVSIWRLAEEIKSTQAAYRRGRDVMILAVAYPYDHWHDVTTCYMTGNWKVDLREVPAEKTPVSELTATRDSIVHLELHRDETEVATVLFAFVAPNGEPIMAPRKSKDFVESIRQRFGFDQEKNPDFRGFLVQVLFPRTKMTTDASALQEQLALFEEIIDQIRTDWTRKGSGK